MPHADPLARKKYMQAWHETNRLHVLERQADYIKKNRDKLIAYYRQWRIDNAEKYRSGVVRYRSHNREILRKRQREYVRKNPEKIRAYFEANRERLYSEKKVKRRSPEYKVTNRNYSHRRRARERNVISTATREQILSLLSKAKRCYYCSRPFGKRLRPTIDHIIAISNGGPHSLDNLLAACKSCNSAKRNKGADLISTRFGVLPL